MIEGRRVLPSDRKPCGLEYNRGGIATQSLRPIVMFAVITSVISVVVGAKVINKFTSRTCEGMQQVETMSGFSALELALDSFQLDVGRYPTKKEGLSALLEAPPGTESRWHGPYIKPREVRDPWGRAFVYHGRGQAPHDSYHLVSCGPDGIEGTSDDLVTTENMPAQ